MNEDKTVPVVSEELETQCECPEELITDEMRAECADGKGDDDE